MLTRAKTRGGATGAEAGVALRALPVSVQKPEVQARTVAATTRAARVLTGRV